MRRDGGGDEVQHTEQPAVHPGGAQPHRVRQIQGQIAGQHHPEAGKEPLADHGGIGGGAPAGCGRRPGRLRLRGRHLQDRGMLPRAGGRDADQAQGLYQQSQAERLSKPAPHSQDAGLYGKREEGHVRRGPDANDRNGFLGEPRA